MAREMKHTEIGDIPVDWELQTFEETFRVLSNNTLSRDNLNSRGGVVRNIHYGDILTKFPELLDCSEEEIPYVNDMSLLTVSTQLLQDGDIVIADTAEDETVGKVTEVQNLGNERLVAGLHTIPCRVKKGDFVPGWLGYYMNSHVYHNQVIPFITGIKVSSISKSAIRKTLILVPPIEEQGTIVEACLSLDKLICNLSKQIEKERYIKIGMVQHLIEEKHQLDGYCENWVSQELWKFADVLNGDRGENYPSTKDMIPYGIPFINAGHLKDGLIDFSKMEYISSAHYEKMGGAKLKTGDILFCLRGSLGKYALVDFEGGAPASSLCVIRCKNNMLSEYLYQILGSAVIKQLIEDTNSGSSQPNLSAENVKHFLIHHPRDLFEQRGIVSVCSTQDNLINRLIYKMQKYVRIKQGMMSELFTGRLLIG